MTTSTMNQHALHAMKAQRQPCGIRPKLPDTVLHSKPLDCFVGLIKAESLEIFCKRHGLLTFTTSPCCENICKTEHTL